MNENEQFKRGSILIDRSIVDLGYGGVYRDAPLPQFFLRGLMQFVEAIVLHEVLVIPFKDTSDIQPPFIPQELNEIITLVEVNSNEINQMGGVLRYKKAFEIMKSTSPNAEYVGVFRKFADTLEHLIDFLSPLELLTIASSKNLPIMFSHVSLSFTLPLIRAVSDNMDELELKNRRKDVNEKILDEITQSVKGTINEINSILPADRFTLDIPIVFNYILERVHKREDIISVALEVRNSKEARNFREHLALLDEATMVDDKNAMISLSREIRDKIDTLGRKLNQPSVGLTVGFPPTIQFDPLGTLKRINFKRKRHLMFIQQLYDVVYKRSQLIDDSADYYRNDRIYLLLYRTIFLLRLTSEASSTITKTFYPIGK